MNSVETRPTVKHWIPMIMHRPKKIPSFSFSVNLAFSIIAVEPSDCEAYSVYISSTMTGSMSVYRAML